MKSEPTLNRCEKLILIFLAVLFIIPPGLAQTVRNSERQPISRTDRTPISASQPIPSDSTEVANLEIAIPVTDSEEATDSIPPTVVYADDYQFTENGKIPFNPSPARAVWLSALFPGLGQIYNRRYWKLPIVVGGFMGLGYATVWNGNQYTDYMQAYRDLLDSDPASKSYMDFFPPTVDESSLDQSWLERTFKYRKDYYRRNRDLCIICLVALYLVCMIDAYVDASMAHFDISPNLSMDIAPAVITPQNQSWKRTALGLQWAITF